MGKGREREPSKRTQLMEKRAADDLDQTVDVDAKTRGIPALPFVAPPAGKGAPPAHPVASKRPAHDPLEGTVQLGPETTRQVVGKSPTPFRGRRSPTREVSTAAVAPPARAAEAQAPEAAAAQTPASAPRRRAQSWDAPPPKPASLRAKPIPASPAPVARAPTPAPQALAAAPAAAATVKTPARTAQEIRGQARALDELCGSEDGDLERFKKRRAAGSRLERADLERMRHILRWLGEALASGDDDDKRRLEELWRVVGPVVPGR
ncbi:MAG: hypothetical protein IPM79_00810 [Polyangiaceae bacterium]|jgi:hypothetical protein|nr:hypothetical protein [Polyangiaceae bacterium]